MPTYGFLAFWRSVFRLGGGIFGRIQERLDGEGNSDASSDEELALQSRLRRLERSSRRMKLAFLLTVIALVIVGAGATQKDEISDVVRARAFCLIDEDGLPSAWLRIWPPSEGIDEKETHPLAQETREPSASLHLYSPEGGFVSISASGERPSLGLLGSSGASVFVSDSSLSLYDNNGLARVVINATGEPGPRISVYDERGEPRAVLGSAALEGVITGDKTNTSESSLVLFGRDGKTIYRAP